MDNPFIPFINSQFAKKINSQFEIFAAISIAAIFSQLFISSFRDDIYVPMTDYIFPDMFKDVIIKNPEKRDINLGPFLRNIIIWTLTILLLTLLF
jgi:hypothetical protein